MLRDSMFTPLEPNFLGTEEENLKKKKEVHAKEEIYTRMFSVVLYKNVK